MATRFIAKHGLKSNINRLTLSEGEIAIAYNDDRTTAEIYSGSKNGTPILLVPGVDVAELLANAQEYTNTKISELVDGAPEAMDTLKELADAISKNSDIMSALQSAIGNKANVADLNTHTSDTSNPHGVTKEQVGLGNVDNTSDMDKPVSTATQEALDSRASKFHASSNNNYGAGSSTAYGHVKLSDSTSSTSNVLSGIAATPKATKTAYDKAVEAYELANQNQYTHPSTHPASMIVQDSTHRFVSDNEISDWDSNVGVQDEIYDGWTLWEVAESVSEFSSAFNTNSFAGAGEMVEKLTDAMRSATIVVGASNSKYHSDHIHAVDYECTGTNDQTVINNAISALPSTGGKIVLLEGTYNISGQITVNKPNVTICGMGNSTVLQRKFNGNNVIYVTSANCELAYFKVDGDSATYTNTANCNIQTYGAGYQNIHDITTVNATDCGIKIRNACHYSNIYNISADGNKLGIVLDGTTGAKICKNTVTNSTATGILLSWNTRDCVVAENVVDTATTYGICIENTNSCVRNVVANNVVRKCATNIYVNNSYNIVACNMVEPETGQKTIHVGSSGKYNYVTGNYIYSINYTNDGGTTNTFSNNKYS